MVYALQRYWYCSTSWSEVVVTWLCSLLKICSNVCLKFDTFLTVYYTLIKGLLLKTHCSLRVRVELECYALHDPNPWPWPSPSHQIPKPRPHFHLRHLSIPAPSTAPSAPNSPLSVCDFMGDSGWAPGWEQKDQPMIRSLKCAAWHSPSSRTRGGTRNGIVNNNWSAYMRKPTKS